MLSLKLLLVLAGIMLFGKPVIAFTSVQCTIGKFGKSSSVCPFKFSAENKLSSFLQKITLSRKATRTVSQSQQQIVCSAESEGLRNGCATDADMIRKMIQEEKMNPLFLDPSNFVVAEQDGEVLGFGQIRSQGSEFELSSLVVRKDMRGMGIGTAIVNELLKRHKERFSGAADGQARRAGIPSVLLLTLSTTTRFYTRLGFQELPISMAPIGMQMEHTAGGVLVKIASGPSAQLVCLRYRFPTVEMDKSGAGTMLRTPGK